MIYNEYGINERFSLIRTFSPNGSNGLDGDFNGDFNGTDIRGVTVITGGRGAGAGSDDFEMPAWNGGIYTTTNQLTFNVTDNYSDNDKSFNINSYYAYITFHNYSCQYDNNYSYVSLTLHNKTTYISKNQTYFISLSNIGIINYEDVNLWYKPDVILAEGNNVSVHKNYIYFEGGSTPNDGLVTANPITVDSQNPVPGFNNKVRRLLYDTLVYPQGYYIPASIDSSNAMTIFQKYMTASYIVSTINEYPSYIYEVAQKDKFHPYLNYIRDFNNNYHLYIYTYTYIANGLYASFLPVFDRVGRTGFSGSSTLPTTGSSQKQSTSEYKKVTLWDLKTSNDYFSDTQTSNGSSVENGVKRICYFITRAMELVCTRPPEGNIATTYFLFSAPVNNPTAYTYYICSFTLGPTYTTPNQIDGPTDNDKLKNWAKNKNYLKSFIYARYNDRTGTDENPHYSYVPIGLDFFLREGDPNDALPDTYIYNSSANINYRFNLALYSTYLYGYDIYNGNYVKFDDNTHTEMFTYLNRFFDNSTVLGNSLLKKSSVISPCLFNLFLYNTYTGETLSDSFYTRDNIKYIETTSNNTEEMAFGNSRGSSSYFNKVAYNYHVPENDDIIYYEYVNNNMQPVNEFTLEHLHGTDYANNSAFGPYYYSFQSTYSYNIMPKYVSRYACNSKEDYETNNSLIMGDFIAYESSKPINGIDRNIITNMNIDLYDNMVVFEIWYNDKVYNYGTPSEKIIPINFYNSINTYYSDNFISNKKFNIYKPKHINSSIITTTDHNPSPVVGGTKMNVSKQIPLFSSYMLKEETFNNENYISAKAILYKNDNTVVEKNDILRKVYNIYDTNTKKSNILLDSNLLYDFTENSNTHTLDIKSVTILLGVDAPVSNVKFNEESLKYIKAFYPEYIPIDEDEDKSINVELYGTYYITSYNTSNITYLNYTNTINTEQDLNSYILTLDGNAELSNQEITNIGNNLYNLNIISQNDFINVKEVEFNISNVIGEYQYVKQENKELDTFIKFVADTPIISSSSDNIPIHIEVPQYKKDYESNKYPLL